MNTRKSGIFSIAVTVIVCLILMVGVGFILYPTVMDKWNEHVNRVRIEKYTETIVEATESGENEDLWQAALQYNQAHTENVVYDAFSGSSLTEKEQLYLELVNPNGNGVMGYIDIPKIKVKLAVHHGATPEVLNEGVGHLPGTSLPVGGTSSHTVLTGHRGLPSAKLFTDLDQLRPGDQFHLHILGHVLAYEVDNVQVVEPNKVEALAIQEGKDLATLVTCTPYGINSHRLLITGHRVDYSGSETIRVYDTIDPLYIMAAIAIALLLIITIILIIIHRRRNY